MLCDQLEDSTFGKLQDKNAALKAAGAIVPESFEGFEGIIKKTYDQLVEDGQIEPQPEPEVKTVPLDMDAAKKAGKVRLTSQESVTCMQPLTELVQGCYLMELCSSSSSKLSLLQQPPCMKCCSRASQMQPATSQRLSRDVCPSGEGPNPDRVLHL